MIQSIVGVIALGPVGGTRCGRWLPCMLSRRGQLLARLKVKPSFAGTGLLERMRSTTFALLGITAAMGLGLVAVISQQGWPVLPVVPIPGLEADQAKVHDAAVAARSHGSSAAERAPRASAAEPAAKRNGAAPEPEDAELAGSRQLTTAPPATALPADPAPGPPAQQGASPEPQPVAPPANGAATATPAAAPAPTAPPVVSSSTPPPPLEESDEDDEEPDAEAPEAAAPEEEADDYHGRGHGYGHWRH